jgi:hypothetical protein
LSSNRQDGTRSSDWSIQVDAGDGEGKGESRDDTDQPGQAVTGFQL